MRDVEEIFTVPHSQMRGKAEILVNSVWPRVCRETMAFALATSINLNARFVQDRAHIKIPRAESSELPHGDWRQPSASPRPLTTWFIDTCKQKPILFSIPTTTAHLRALPLVRKRIFRSTNKERNPPQRRVLALNRLEPDPMVTARLLPFTRYATQMSVDKDFCAGTNTADVITR